MSRIIDRTPAQQPAAGWQGLDHTPGTPGLVDIGPMGAGDASPFIAMGRPGKLIKSFGGRP